VADQPAKSTKRRVVKNPETFRERAIKATAEADQPSKRGLPARLGSRLLMPVLRPIGRAIQAAFAVAPLKWLKRPLRLIGKVVFPPYVRNSWRELQQVSWPSWRESRRLTFAVLIFAVIFGGTIALVDYGLDKVFRAILLK